MTINIPGQHQQLIAHFESHLRSAGFTRIRRAEHLSQIAASRDPALCRLPPPGVQRRAPARG